MIQRSENYKAYVALTTILIIIPILLMGGIALLYSNMNLLISTQSMYASSLSNNEYNTCLEESVLKIKRDNNYTGTLTINFPSYTCTAVISNYMGNTNIKQIDITVTSGIYTYNRVQIVDISISPYSVSNL